VTDAERTDWPEKPVMLWEREVGGGHSGPIVAGDRVWVHARKGGKEVVSSLKLADGETVWSRGHEVPFEQDESALDHGLGPYATPSLADGRLFTLGVTAILSAWDAGEGTLLWRREYSEEFDPSFPFFGAAGSPLVWGDLCFVHFGASEGQKQGNPGRGAMVALRVADGSEEWRWSLEGPSLGASPVIGEINGRWQLVFKSKEHIVGLDARTGKELWRIPFKVTEDNTIVTPLLIGDRLLTSDYEMGFRAWRIESKEGRWAARELWNNKKASLFMSSPVMVAGQVVGFSHLRKGQLFGLDPSDGKVLWRGEPAWGEHASLISWGSEVLVFLEDGSLVIGEVSRDRFRSLRRYSLGSAGMYGHPAIVDNRIVIKDGERLAVYRIDATADGPASSRP
jgi:outer membrane protein assembly factor BamB